MRDRIAIAKPVELLRFDEPVGGKRRTMGLTAHLAVAIEGVKWFCRDFPLHTPAQTAGLIRHLYRSFLGRSVILPGKGFLQSRNMFFLPERPFMAVDCLLPGFYEGPFTRKPTLKLSSPSAVSDPTMTLAIELRALRGHHQN